MPSSHFVWETITDDDMLPIGELKHDPREHRVSAYARGEKEYLFLGSYDDRDDAMQSLLYHVYK